MKNVHQKSCKTQWWEDFGRYDGTQALHYLLLLIMQLICTEITTESKKMLMVELQIILASEYLADNTLLTCAGTGRQRGLSYIQHMTGAGCRTTKVIRGYFPLTQCCVPATPMGLRGSVPVISLSQIRAAHGPGNGG